MVQVYDPRENNWTRRAPLSVPTTHWNAVPIGHIVWLAGGFVGDHPGHTTTDVWRYDAVADRWTRGPSLPAESEAAASCFSRTAPCTTSAAGVGPGGVRGRKGTGGIA